MNYQTAKYREITFSDADVVNWSNFIPKGEYNPHNIHPWLLHDHGFALAVVFASTLQDALGEAVDENKLDHFQVSADDLAKMSKQEQESLAHLGNASEAFDIESVSVEELPNPPFSFVALFNAARKA